MFHRVLEGKESLSLKINVGELETICGILIKKKLVKRA